MVAPSPFGETLPQLQGGLKTALTTGRLKAAPTTVQTPRNAPDTRP